VLKSTLFLTYKLLSLKPSPFSQLYPYLTTNGIIKSQYFECSHKVYDRHSYNFHIPHFNKLTLPSQGTGDQSHLKFIIAAVSVWVPILLTCWYGEHLTGQVLLNYDHAGSAMDMTYYKKNNL
jgi:hypothetical protein